MTRGGRLDDMCSRATLCACSECLFSFFFFFWMGVVLNVVCSFFSAVNVDHLMFFLCFLFYPLSHRIYPNDLFFFFLFTSFSFPISIMYACFMLFYIDA